MQRPCAAFRTVERETMASLFSAYEGCSTEDN